MTKADMTRELTPDQERTAIEDTQKWLLEAVVGLNLLSLIHI